MSGQSVYFKRLVWHFGPFSTLTARLPHNKPGTASVAVMDTRTKILSGLTKDASTGVYVRKELVKNSIPAGATCL